MTFVHILTTVVSGRTFSVIYRALCGKGAVVLRSIVL